MYEIQFLNVFLESDPDPQTEETIKHLLFSG